MWASTVDLYSQQDGLADDATLVSAEFGQSILCTGGIVFVLASCPFVRIACAYEYLSMPSSWSFLIALLGFPYLLQLPFSCN